MSSHNFEIGKEYKKDVYCRKKPNFFRKFLKERMESDTGKIFRL